VIQHSNAAPKSRGYTPLIIKCQAYGMTNHARKQCASKHHELANNTSQPWDHSTRGKMWASHGKSHLTIGYAIPGCPAIQHSDGIYPKPNPYAKSHYQSNSSNLRYRQGNTNNYNRDQINNNYNRDNNNNNRDNSAGRNNNITQTQTVVPTTITTAARTASGATTTTTITTIVIATL
jgi:hypothetical protein